MGNEAAIGGGEVNGMDDMSVWDWLGITLGTIGFAAILAFRWVNEVVKNLFFGKGR